MKTLKKIAAVTAALTVASSFAGCSPSIGGNSQNAATIGEQEVPAGVFIYYTLQAYSEASSIIQGDGETAPEADEIRNANIDEIDSTSWIQNKATEYCKDYAGLVTEFEAIGGKLSSEDIDEAAEMAEYYYSMDPRLASNGVSLDSMKAIAESTYMETEIFKYHYGFDGEKGCSEEELKDFVDDNFARIKYVSISLKDQDGEKVDAAKEKEIRKMADDYVKQVNAKSGDLNKMHEMDAISEDYNEYVAANTTTAVGETTTTTTTTTTAAGVTTTTDPYANERLIQKATTTTAAVSTGTETTTETAEESETDKNTRLFNEYVFNDLKAGKAVIYEFSEDTIYVVLRADLRERMTEDDYWSEEYITQFQSIKYYDEYIKYLDEKTNALEVNKNKTAYRRYEPFKLELLVE
ncbi:MAG: hypothetical protein IKV85_04940 [Ruminococcus sp.]|nr:hypothetical protein [Ruminococcus sp.]